MSMEQIPGPLVVYGQPPAGPGGYTPEYNPDVGLSLFWGGAPGLLDPRYWSEGSANTNRAWGFGPNNRVLDAVPYNDETANIAALQHTTAGTALTLVSASGSGVTVVPTGGFTYPTNGTVVAAGAVALDGLPGWVAQGKSPFGPSFEVWDPSKMLARALTITASASTTNTFNVAGYDVYGVAMQETLAISAGTSVTGKKAWKFITSVTPTTTDATNNYSVGTSDIIGLPLLAADFSDVQIVYNQTLITADTGFTAADGTSPATGTTGDVRGTYQLQTAPDNAYSLQVFARPKIGNINSIAGLFGVAQY